MGGGEVCLIAEAADNTQPLVLELRKTFPDITFIYYDMSMQGYKGMQDWAANRPKVVPDDVWKKTTYLVTLATFPPSLDLVPNLKWVHVMSAGVNQLVAHPIYTDTNDIIITSSSGIHGPQIAEWAIMNMLVARHKYDVTYEWQKQHHWGSHRGLGSVDDHVRNRIGILGYGSIGRQVAHVCSAMGMEVLAYTASPRPTPESRKDNGFIVPSTGDPDGTIPSAWYSGSDTASLHTFLSQSLDYLLISVPLTPATRHLISAPELSILAKSRTFLINIARGPIVDSKALLKALNDEEIVGAALDVTDPEPLPADDPLWDAKNVIISPHVSGLATSYTGRSLQIFEGNLTRYREQGAKAMWNVVNRKKGY